MFIVLLRLIRTDYSSNVMLKCMMKDDNSKLRHYWLYVLKLEQDKYYIGITAQNPERRMKQHVYGFAGAAWTSLYKPVEMIEKIDLGELSYIGAELIENKKVREYIKEHGIENVRGGDISETNPMILKFGYIFDKFGWESMLAVVTLTLLIVILEILYYLK